MQDFQGSKKRKLFAFTWVWPWMEGPTGPIGDATDPVVRNVGTATRKLAMSLHLTSGERACARRSMGSKSGAPRKSVAWLAGKIEMHDLRLLTQASTFRFCHKVHRRKKYAKIVPC